MRIPVCSRCGDNCWWVYAVQHFAIVRVRIENVRGQDLRNMQAAWLCADCVDQVAEAVA